ncbi:MAG: hypothetical protein R3F60_25210 [bacterium]
MKPIGLLSLARVALGLYLAVVLARLLPWAEDLYGQRGVLGDVTLSPLHGVLPAALHAWDVAPAVFVGALVALALALAAGLFPRVAAVLLWAGWALLWHRNVFTLNPAVPCLGFLLLAVAATPGRGAMPRDVWRVVTIVLAVGYTWSGLTKLDSPSWRSGEALGLILGGPLARDVPWVAALQASPALTTLLTWGTLAVELLALPLAASRRLRPWSWLSLVGLHLGILASVQFAELTLGMLVVHLFAFDPAWLPRRRRAAVAAAAC